jgi:ADP-heptose:LPS heptosyltransferase
MKGWACICRLGGVGDNLIAASVLRPLKRLGYMVEMLTSEAAGAVFRNNPFIDKLSIKRDGEIPGGDDWQRWFASRANEYDLLVNLSNSCETRHALHKGTSAFWWPAEYRRRLCAGSYLETVHDIVGVAHDFGPLFFPTEDERTRAVTTREKIGGRYLVWALSGSRIDKLYPYAAHAIARIIKELDIPVVMVGTGGQQFQYAEIVQREVKRSNSTDKGLHLALSPDNADPGGHQHWGIRRSLTLALGADLVVTPDTGVGWAVAMEAMPKIVMVSHASAENITAHWVNTTTLHADHNRVPCWPCHRLHDDDSTCVKAKDANAAACMADIPVETVVQNVARLWAKPDGKVRVLRAA